MRTNKKYIPEFTRTFFWCFIGIGAIIINEISNNVIGDLKIAFAIRLVIIVMIYACRHISGAHFNPATTIVFASSGILH